MFGFPLAEIIGWLALTVIAGLVVWASRAPLDGAKSNLSQWIGVSSRRGSPIVAWRPLFDRFARYGALGIWGTGTLLLALNYLFDQRAASLKAPHRGVFLSSGLRGARLVFVSSGLRIPCVTRIAPCDPTHSVGSAVTSCSGGRSSWRSR